MLEVLGRYAFPVTLQVFGHQSPVAVMWLVFAAEEAASVDHFLGQRFLDAAARHETEEFLLVNVPITLVFRVGVKQLLGWYQVS